MADPPFQKACDPERMREVGSAWCPAQECGCWPKNWQQWGRAPAAGEINRWWTKPSSSRLSTNNQKQQTNNGNKQLGESDRWWTVSIFWYLNLGTFAKSAHLYVPKNSPSPLLTYFDLFYVSFSRRYNLDRLKG